MTLFTFRPKFKLAAVLCVTLFCLAITGLLAGRVARANPDHNAGDYFMFARAAGDGGTDDPKAYEPVCDDANDKQADVSGSDNNVYGRIHSNADLAISGTGNRFFDSGSPNPELTYGVNDGPTSDCQLQAEGGNTYSSGAPLNITGSGNPADVQGPYQIGANGWPGNLGQFLDGNAMTFGNDVSQVLPDEVCDVGSLTHGGVIEVTAADEGKVVCNGGDPIVISVSGLGSPADPFRITMISHGLIDISGSNHYLAPAAHGVLAWTDQRFEDEATSIKIAGDNVNVVSRAILFTPRSGQDVSGSNSSALCVQMIGQGALKMAGSNSSAGPLDPACAPALDNRAYLPLFGGYGQWRVWIAVYQAARHAGIVFDQQQVAIRIHQQHMVTPRRYYDQQRQAGLPALPPAAPVAQTTRFAMAASRVACPTTGCRCSANHPVCDGGEWDCVP